MSETKSENVFRSYKKQLIKQLGKKGLYNDTIDNIGKDLFHSRCQGCHASDQIVCKPGYQIIKVDNSKQPGSHWLAIYQTNKNCYIFDSFGRPSNQLIRNVTQKLREKGIQIYDSDLTDAEQRGNSEVCGQLSLSWLMVVKFLGIKAAMLI